MATARSKPKISIEDGIELEFKVNEVGDIITFRQPQLIRTHGTDFKFLEKPSPEDKRQLLGFLKKVCTWLKDDCKSTLTISSKTGAQIDDLEISNSNEMEIDEDLQKEIIKIKESDPTFTSPGEVIRFAIRKVIEEQNSKQKLLFLG